VKKLGGARQGPGLPTRETEFSTSIEKERPTGEDWKIEKKKGFRGPKNYTKPSSADRARAKNTLSAFGT